jgi:hypothetical protein
LPILFTVVSGLAVDTIFPALAVADTVVLKPHQEYRWHQELRSTREYR